MKLRRFSQAGIERFQVFLDSVSSGAPLPWPESALSDPEYSSVLDCAVALEDRSFASRFELAQFLDQRFASGGFDPHRGDGCLWSWIGCRYFREVCPKDKMGRWKPGAAARWIPRSSDFRRYYRHLFLGPWSIYRAYRDRPERALALLCQPPGRPGDLVEQLASRQQVVTNPVILEVATGLYVDPVSGKQRRSANAKGRGGPRRLITVLDQLDLTWDLAMLSTGRLQEMLSAEFGGREGAVELRTQATPS
jgi:hypothetical protein